VRFVNATGMKWRVVTLSLAEGKSSLHLLLWSARFWVLAEGRRPAELHAFAVFDSVLDVRQASSSVMLWAQVGGDTLAAATAAAAET
jgi:hypothetical protein